MRSDADRLREIFVKLCEELLGIGEHSTRYCQVSYVEEHEARIDSHKIKVINAILAINKEDVRSFGCLLDKTIGKVSIVVEIELY